VKCVSSAYAKLMLCVPLPLALEGESKKDFSKAYAMHMNFIYLFLHFNVLMQPKAMKHSILSTYIDTHRVVLTMYVV
jgi:hypothetical protein